LVGIDSSTVGGVVCFWWARLDLKWLWSGILGYGGGCVGWGDFLMEFGWSMSFGVAGLLRDGRLLLLYRRIFVYLMTG